jgi:uncharacterized protein YbjT (DUF2867 family)
MKKYVITGATGNTGLPIAEALLDAGHQVRIIARRAERAAKLTEKGAILFAGDSKDAALLSRAFDGADAAYIMIPFDAQTRDYYHSQVEHVDAVVAALKESGLKYAVTLSSVGVHLSEGNGVVQGLYYMEQALNAIEGLNVKHLRAGYFLENTLMQASTYKHMGIMGTQVRADIQIPMVATKDISAAALKNLLNLDFEGSSVQYVLGARDYTYTEIASIYGKIIGKEDVNYVQFPYDQAAQAMMQMGMGESVVTRLNEFVKAMNEGLIQGDYVRDASNTTPTTAEQFGQVFKMVYEME